MYNERRFGKLLSPKDEYLYSSADSSIVPYARTEKSGRHIIMETALKMASMQLTDLFSISSLGVAAVASTVAPPASWLA